MNQFDVYAVNLEPSKGLEIKNIRPAVIISPNAMNKNLKTVIVAPLTRTIKNYPSRVKSSFRGEIGQIALDQLRAVDKIRLHKMQGKVDSKTAQNIKVVLATMFS